ncbi:MAG: DUF58 domain-containing protein [Prevotellaceae bacterium]|jgi:hypothetical protein|nr:DUF58 domain-containing protein [Prevotellaceae bacterium]
MKYKTKIREIRKKIPVRTVFFIVLLVFIAVDYFDSNASEKVMDIAALLVKIMIFVIASIVVFSIATILIPFLLYLKTRKQPSIEFLYDSKNNILCKIECNRLIFPLVGNVKAELIFSRHYDTMVTLKRQGGGKATGLKKLSLPDIQNYELETVTLFFYDFFRMFSLYRTFRLQSSISILPTGNREHSVANVFPATDRDEIRTDTFHRKEGEMLKFKNFESSDDIRRIVWSVYARSGELIVRTTEMLNMYASQIDVFASFNGKYNNVLDAELASRFLNYYKTSIWEICLSLKTADREINFISDRKAAVTTNNEREIAVRIAEMSWHRDKIDEYLLGRKIAVCCISSMIAADEVEKLMDAMSENTFIVFVRLQSVVEKHTVGSILRKIFTVQDEKFNWKWLFSNLRKQINSNDKKILNILQSRKMNYLEI